MFEPVYGPEPAAPVLRPTRYDIQRLGIYAQDQIRLNSVVTIVPGLRWSRLAVENRTPAGPAANGETPEASADYAVSPSLGVVVLPRTGLALLYATASRGFEPPTPGQYLEDGRAVAPADSRLLEGGAKADLFGRRMAASAAVYEIRRTNVPEADARGFYSQIGEGRSRGVEAEAAGSVWRGLGIQGGYAWTRSEIPGDTAGLAGRQLPHAPRHNASVWRLRPGRFPESAQRDRVCDSSATVHDVRGGQLVQPLQSRIRENARGLSEQEFRGQVHAGRGEWG